MNLPAPRELRPYQTAAADAVERDWREGIARAGVVLPTGAGKSTVIGELIQRAYWLGETILAMAHRGELIDQMKRDLLAVAPEIPLTDIGIVRAEMDDHHCPIVFATLQTLATAKRREALGRRTRIFWDEVHHAGADGFHTSFSELGGYSGALMAGFTATMNRDQRGEIGLGDVIEKISFERDLPWAIKEGYLVMPRGMTVRINGLNALNDVRNVAGDFHQAELAEIMEAATDYVVDAIKLHAADRTPIIFAASVDAAHHIAEALTDSDFPAVAVTGELSYADRQPLYAAFRSGEIRALVTVQVLTEGADFPMCDTVVLARPTRSKNLYSQMIGRALRLYDGKIDALVLDLAGSARAMKLVNLTQLLPGVVMDEVDQNGDPFEVEPEIEESGGGGDLIPLVRTGVVDMVSIDLLAKSDNLWMETVKGVPFISLMSEGETVFLWPKDGVLPAKGESPSTTTWAIGQRNTRNGVGGWATASGRYISEAGPDFTDFESALEAAEVWIVETDQHLIRRNDSWRRNAKPSEAQIRYAKTLGIVGIELMNKPQLSDEITSKVVSRYLDKLLSA